MRIKLSDVMASRIPQAVGFCNSDTVAVASLINEATQRLIGAASQTGWWGGWARAVFSVSKTNPYLTIPPQFARAVNFDACRTPISLGNEWVEFLEDGIGLQTICDGLNGCSVRAAYSRGSVPTAFDLPDANSYIRVYYTNSRDVGKRILFSGVKDANDVGVYTADGLNKVDGFFLVFQAPFSTSTFVVKSVSDIAKSETYGDIVIRAVNASTGAETFLSRLTSKETNASYRRYYFHALPCACCPCPSTPGFVQITAMLKYEFIPVSQPTDFLIIGNIPALKEEVMSLRFSEMDSVNGTQLAESHHRKAVKLLNDELNHYMNRDEPAINVGPFQTIGLGRGGLNLGMT